MKRKIIFDCDPGVDDALALSAILKDDDFEVLGICAVGGNRPLEYTYKNALKLVHFFRYPTKVYKGVAPLEVKELKSSLFHGENGFGGAVMDYDEADLASRNAVDFLIEKLNEYPDEIEIIALGPLSNLAALYQKSPSSFGKIKAIYSMGGSFGMGNITPCCEFNYYFDLAALDLLEEALENNPQVVFHMFPLNITCKAAFDMNEFAFLKYEGGSWGQLVYDMFSSDYMPKSYRVLGRSECVLHDLVAAMYPVIPEIYDEGEKTSFFTSKDTETLGKMIKCKGSASIYVHEDIDAAAMKKKYMEIIYGQQMAEKYEQFIQEMKN